MLLLKLLKWLAKNKMTFQTEKTLDNKFDSLPQWKIWAAIFYDQIWMIPSSAISWGNKYVCGATEIEHNAHVLFNCKLCASAKAQYLQTLLDRFIYWDSNKKYLILYLQGTNTYGVTRTAKFMVRAVQYGTCLIEHIETVWKDDE